MKMDSSAFQDHTVEWSGRHRKPVHASHATRAVYCLALLASIGWVGCLLFEISRWTGYRVSSQGRRDSRSQRIRDVVAL